MKEQQNTLQPEFNIQRIYIKDLSYESPNTPEIFQSEWEPTVDFNLEVHSTKVIDDIYEVILQITVNTKIKDKTAFLIEIKQAGIFLAKNFDDAQLRPLLGSYCPNMLFPYAREAISEAVTRGGFPALYLAPINFDALYEQQQKNGN